MAVNGKTNSGLNQLLRQLAMQKKKTFVAAALVMLMVFMWARLLTGGSPEPAQATTPAQTDSSDSTKRTKIKFVDLPRVEGRHNVLARDFFRMDSQVFGADSGPDIFVTEGGDSKVQQVARRLRLDAISTGSQPQAFINDRLVKAGDIIIVGDENSKTYECEVVSIEENTVVVKYETAEIELNLKKPDDGPNVFED